MKVVDTRPDWVIQEAVARLTNKMLKQVEMEQEQGCSLQRALARAIHDNLLKHIKTLHCVNQVDRYLPERVAKDEGYMNHLKQATMHKLVDELPKSNGLLLHEYDSGYNKIYHYTLAVFDVEGKEE